MRRTVPIAYSNNQPATALNKKGIRDSLLVLALVCVSGNMVFSATGRDAFTLPVLALIVGLMMLAQSSKIHKRFVYVVIAFCVVFAGQTLSFSYLPIVTISGFFIRLFIAYSILRLVENFPKAYVQVMVCVSLLSLAFYIPDQLLNLAGVDFRQPFLPLSRILDVQAYGVNERINIGVYNFQTGDNFARNAAFFWEPGAFAGYLILAIIFLTICRRELPSQLVRLKLILLIVALLTTQSTTGIVVLPFASLLFLNLRFSTSLSRRNSTILLLLAGLLLTTFALTASQLNFVGEKIVRLYNMGVKHEAGWQASRFGAMIFDSGYIRVHPLTGWGQNRETQFQLNEDMERFALGNGMTGFVRQMGLLGMGVFLVSMWLGLRRLGQSKGKAACFIFVVLLTLNGEYFLFYPLYMGLMFLVTTKTSTVNQPKSYHV